MDTPTLPPPSPHIAGRMLDLRWDTGPTKGTAQRHRFHEDGTVDWTTVKSDGSIGEDTSDDAHSRAKERPRYAAIDVGGDVCLVSYLAPSGWTLTCALDFGSGQVRAIASNATQWMPVEGTFKVVEA